MGKLSGTDAILRRDGAPFMSMNDSINDTEEKNLRWLAALSGLSSIFGIGGMLVGQLYLKRCDRKSWFIYGGVAVWPPVAMMTGGNFGGAGLAILSWAVVIGFIGMIVGTIKKSCGLDAWLVYGGAWAGTFLIPFVAILPIGGVEITSRSESQRIEPQPIVQNTPTAARNVQIISAAKLYAERENDATRFAHMYKDKRIITYGLVERIVNDTVYLDVGVLDEVALKGLPARWLLDLNSGDTVRAECTVGNYIPYTIYLDDCD